MLDSKQLEELALAEIKRTVDQLPAPLRARAAALPVVLQLSPSPEQLRDQIDPDTLGLFVGTEFEHEEMHGALPPSIVLFLQNIWDLAEGDVEVFCEEVHTTFLHELGHYLGLDEDGLIERGLE